MIAIEVKISKAGRLSDGTVKPLVLKLTTAAHVMATELKKMWMGDNKKITFQTSRPSALSDEYMRLIGSRFGNKQAWEAYANAQKDKARPNLRLGEKGWTWRSSDFWHKVARKDDASFNRTGGMWSGLRVRNYAGKGAIIEFAGKSEGQSGEWKTGRGRTKAGQPKKQKWSGKVNNSLKAWTVFKEKKALLVEPDAQLQLAFETGIEAAIAQWVDGQLGATIPAARSVTLGGLSAQFFNALK